MTDPTTTIQGVEIGIGIEDAGVNISAKIEAQYPAHLVLVQSGSFLRGYNRTAYALHKLKSWKLKLAGTSDKPHLQVGFPMNGHKRRLWTVVHEFGIPYVVALGTHAEGYTLHISDADGGNSDALNSVSTDVVSEVIADLRANKALDQVAAKKILAKPETATFQLKEKAQALDEALLNDILKLPRDIRTTWGESVRACMARMMYLVFAYGQEDNKPQLLKKISADVDLLKHYICQAKQLSQFKAFNFEHRAGLAVELGRIVGGLIRQHGASHD